MAKLALLIYYHKNNRYSFNALLGALELYPNLVNMPIILARTEEDIYQELPQLLANNEKVAVAISVGTSQVSEIFMLMKKLLKQYKRQPHYIAGGAHATGSPISVLALGFDTVVIGEGEITFPEILTKIQEDQDIHSVKGIAYFQDKEIYAQLEYLHAEKPLFEIVELYSNKVVYTPKQVPCNLDEIPPFARNILAVGPLEITRGCPNMCYFCQTPYIFGAKPRHRSIEVICNIVKELVPRGPHDLRFLTPNLLNYASPDGKTICLEAMEEVFDKLRDILGSEGRLFLGTFPSEVRPDFVTPQTISLLKKYASNDNLTIGGQSGSQRMLDLCHRGHTVEDIYQSANLASEAGFKVNIDFIFGLPNETKEDIHASLEMIKKLVKMGCKIHAHTFMPLPQTPFSKYVPTPIQDYRKQIEKLISQGSVFGTWKNQERLNKKRNL